MNNNIKKFFGFTLAEVLITIGVIGIVAALTIPTIMSKVDKQTNLVSLKKAYSVMTQALIQLANDSGCAGDLKCAHIFDDTEQNMGDAIAKYFKVLKNCGDYTTTGITGCLSDETAGSYDGANRTALLDEVGYRFITVDGISYALWSTGTNCVDNISRSGSNNVPMAEFCGYAYIDVNGPVKGPNNMGIDVFEFYITNGKGPGLYPAGGSDDDENNPWKDDDGNPVGCFDGNPDGLYCPGRIIEEGWQINY